MGQSFGFGESVSSRTDQIKSSNASRAAKFAREKSTGSKPPTRRRLEAANQQYLPVEYR